MRLEKENKESHVDASKYCRLVGKLLYLQATRFDLTYVVNVLSQFVSDPRQDDLDAAMRVLRYLKAAPGQGVVFPKQGGTNLISYCDADWLGCPYTQRSRTGYVLLLGGALVSWKSKKHMVVSRSSAEAEYRAMTTTVNKIIWMRWPLNKLDVKQIRPTPIYCDNQVACNIATIPIFHERTKHVEMDCYIVRERVNSQVVPLPIYTKMQVAYLFTKALCLQ